MGVFRTDLYTQTPKRTFADLACGVTAIVPTYSNLIRVRSSFAGHLLYILYDKRIEWCVEFVANLCVLPNVLAGCFGELGLRLGGSKCSTPE